jgi:hypothetical protein
VTRLIIFAMLSGLCLAGFSFYGQADKFVLIEESPPRRIDTSGHWATDGVHITTLDSGQALEVFHHIWLNRMDITDPNNPARVIGHQNVGLTLTEFNILSRGWKPQPAIIPPVIVEPNEPPAIVEPNLPDISNLCFTVGGKHHLYIDCSYLTGRTDLTIEDCAPNNICIRCAARKVREL